MNLELSAPAQEFRRRFEAWVAEHLPAEWRDLRAGDGDDAALVEVRRAWGRRLHQDGWIAPHWPAEYGGLGLGVDEHVAQLEVLVATGAPEPMNQNGIGILAPAVLRFGTDDQKRRWLPPMLAHDELWCQGFSEPEAGSDLASLRTRAEADGDGWRLTGQKVWTSYAQWADRSYVLASAVGRGITLFVLDMHQPEVTVRPLRNLTGTSEFSEVFLDGAWVSGRDVVGAVGGGWSVATFALGRERSTGLAQRSLQLRREFLNLITAVGAVDPEALSGRDFVEGFVRSRVVGSLVGRVLALAAGGEEPGMLAPMAKLTWSESHQAQLALLVDHLGQDLMLDRAGPWLRTLLFARAETIYGGTSDIQRNLIAKQLGLPSDRVPGGVGGLPDH